MLRNIHNSAHSFSTALERSAKAENACDSHHRPQPRAAVSASSRSRFESRCVKTARPRRSRPLAAGGSPTTLPSVPCLRIFGSPARSWLAVACALRAHALIVAASSGQGRPQAKAIGLPLRLVRREPGGQRQCSADCANRRGRRRGRGAAGRRNQGCYRGP